MRFIRQFLILFCISLFTFSIQAGESKIKNLVIKDPLVKKMWDSLRIYNNQQQYYEAIPLLFRLELEAEKAAEINVLFSTLENLGGLSRNFGWDI